MQKNKDASLNKRHEQDVRTNKRKERYFVVKSKNTHLGLFFLEGVNNSEEEGLYSFFSISRWSLSQQEL